MREERGGSQLSEDLSAHSLYPVRVRRRSLETKRSDLLSRNSDLFLSPAFLLCGCGRTNLFLSICVSFPVVCPLPTPNPTPKLPKCEFPGWKIGEGRRKHRTINGDCSPCVLENLNSLKGCWSGERRSTFESERSLPTSGGLELRGPEYRSPRSFCGQARVGVGRGSAR